MASNNGKSKARGTVQRPGRGPQAPLIEKIAQWIVIYRLPLAAAMLAVALVLGFIGNISYLAAQGEPASLWDISYYTLRLVNPAAAPVQGPVNIQIQIARLLAAVAGFYIAVEALLSIFRDQVQSLRIRGMRDHTLICGLGRKGLLLADAYRMKGEQVVVIERDGENPSIGHCIDQGIVVLKGNAVDPQFLRKARVLRARRLVSVCGSDGTNAEVVLQARQIVSGRVGRALACVAHITDRQLWAMLRDIELRMGAPDTFRLTFFNIYESGARAMLYEYPFFDPTAGNAVSTHIFVVGLGRLGTALVVNSARRWKDSDAGDGRRLRVSVVDATAGKKLESLRLGYPRMEDACELRPVDVDVNSPEFEKGEFLFSPDGRCGADAVYICLGDESEALTAALQLNRRLKALKIPVIVRMQTAGGLSMLLRDNPDGEAGNGNLHAFPLLEMTCTPESIWGGSANEMLARAIHEEYIRNAIRRGETPQTNQSMVPWNKLPASLQESSRNQAEYITAKLRQFNYDFDMTNDWEITPLQFTSQEVEGMARLEHTRFVEERLREGWKLGPVKDAGSKISPTLIPWEDLSEMEKDKDRELVRGIPAFLTVAGYSLRRSGSRAVTDFTGDGPG